MSLGQRQCEFSLVIFVSAPFTINFPVPTLFFSTRDLRFIQLPMPTRSDPFAHLCWPTGLQSNHGRLRHLPRPPIPGYKTHAVGVCLNSARGGTVFASKEA
ncbi:hypothetical protein FA13DRAFT_333175 [Coprinellus micaceus]|uniref:Uncharacterized protein n=1 Tax=Coprinellus micaceus TaxID=71717 RepID=A0A4Y7TBQ0_COPMI|nr:hypothetical protein FA13DRAFT_333175 [Coprinellus micaceus]